MAGPSVLLAGVGGAGVAIAGWSRALHLREIAYLAIDSDPETLAASGIARDILIGRVHGTSLGGSFSAHQEQVLAQAVTAADICIIVAGMGGRTGSSAALALARIARRHRSRILCVAVLPVEQEPPAVHARARRALARLARTSDVLFVMPLTLLSLADCNVPAQDERTRQLYDWVDRIVDLATAPAGINLILRAIAQNPPGEAALGLFRRMLLHETDIGIVERLNRDIGLLPAQFTTARDVALLVRASTLSALATSTILAEVSAVFPDDVAVDCIARPAALPAELLGVELVSFCPAPEALAEQFNLTATSCWQSLMPWSEPAPPPITTAYRGLFGAHLETSARPQGDALAAAPVRAAASLVSRSWNQLRSDPTYAAGGLMEWLDRALGELETHLAAAWGVVRRRWDHWRDTGERPRVGALLRAPIRLVQGVRSIPHEAALRNWRSLAAVLLLVLLPFGIATIVVNNLGAISRTNSLIRGEPTDLLEEFVERDQERIAKASATTPLTDMEFSQLGPAAYLPSPMTAYLDKWAVGEHFLNLHRFAEARVPYAFINAADPRLRGQLRLVADFAGENTKSRIQTLHALGIFPNLAQLPPSAGIDAGEAAADIDDLYAAADEELDFATAARNGGCATVRDAVARRFLLKRLSPDRVSLSYVHYVLALALPAPGDCTANLEKALASLESLKAYKGISFVKSSQGAELEQRAYAIVVPRAILGPPDLSNDLGVYVAGLRAFYLLDFAAADRLFGKLSMSANPVAATTGTFLAARAIYWRHEFARGAYRPDRYPPWRHLDEDFYEVDYSGEIGGEIREAAGSGGLPRCAGVPSPTSHCLYATLRQPRVPREVALAAADRERLKAIAERLARFPVIDPQYLRRYQGEFVEVESELGFQQELEQEDDE